MKPATWWTCLLALWITVTPAQDASVAGPVVLVVRIDGAIGAATAAHVRDALEHAERGGVRLVVMQLDTPGGLDSATREIIKAILASAIPVAGFVSPQGARAASAGTYLMYASHVAAMSPATHLGAATPVAVGPPMPGGPADPPPRRDPSGQKDAAPERGGSGAAPADAMTAKRINDSAAYLRGLALLRDRNAEWAERAVREAVSLTADEAAAQQVVDLIARDVPDLLRRIDGRTVRIGTTGPAAREVTLMTAGATIVEHEPDWRQRLLSVISDPGVALVLMMIGVYGLLFELASPGLVAPGVIGGICLLLALYGLQTLPIDYAGLALLMLGIAFLVAEAFLPSFGLLGIGGIAAFALGALLLVDSDLPGLTIPPWLIASTTIVSALVLIGIGRMAARAGRRPVVGGEVIRSGATGAVIEAEGTSGWAEIDGERWRIRSVAPLVTGQYIRVVRVDGLTLDVEPGKAGSHPGEAHVA